MTTWAETLKANQANLENIRNDRGNGQTSSRITLDMTDRGQIANSLTNSVNILENDHEWAGVLGADQFQAGRLTKVAEPPTGTGAGPWTDGDSIEARLWIEREYDWPVAKALGIYREEAAT